MSDEYTVKARELRAGMVITKAGRTTHSPITVTGVARTVMGRVIVSGHNARNREDRVMFRALDERLPLTIQGGRA